MRRPAIAMLVLPVLMSGCSKDQENTAPAESKQGKIFNTQIQALEKAKGVEQMLQNGADKQRQKIEEQTR